MEEEALEKPTDNELREQIISSRGGSFIFLILGLMISLIVVTFNLNLGFLILSFFIMSSYVLMLSQKLDKIRLEIRETNGKHFKNKK